jgi:hypothetical protein
MDRCRESEERVADSFTGATGCRSPVVYRMRELTLPPFASPSVNHMHSYVRGDVHTNGLENFWSLLKRGVKGTYVSVEPFHPFRYIDEQTFRYNNRKDESGDVRPDGERSI